MLEVDTENRVIEHYQWRAIHQASRILEKIDQRWPLLFQFQRPMLKVECHATEVNHSQQA